MKRTTTVPIYGCPLYFFDDCEDAYRFTLKRCREQGIKPPSRPTHLAGFVFQTNEEVVFSVGDGGVDTLVHEALHAAWEVLNWADVTANYDNQEPLAYLTDWIFSEWIARMGWVGRRLAKR